MLMLGLRPMRSFFVLRPGADGTFVASDYTQIILWGYRDNSQTAEFNVLRHVGPETHWEPRVQVRLQQSLPIDPGLSVLYQSAPGGNLMARFGVTAPDGWTILRDAVVIAAGLRQLLSQPRPLPRSRLSSLQPG